jgi:hypothetical protein
MEGVPPLPLSLTGIHFTLRVFSGYNLLHEAKPFGAALI